MRFYQIICIIQPVQCGALHGGNLGPVLFLIVLSYSCIACQYDLLKLFLSIFFESSRVQHFPVCFCVVEITQLDFCGVISPIRQLYLKFKFKFNWFPQHFVYCLNALISFQRIIFPAKIQSNALQRSITSCIYFTNKIFMSKLLKSSSANSFPLAPRSNRCNSIAKLIVWT